MRDKRFDSHLTGVILLESFYWLTRAITKHYKGYPLEVKSKTQMRPVENVYSAKTKSTVSFNSPI